MSAVMLNVEADACYGQPEQNGQRHGLPPGLSYEYQQDIGGREQGKNDRRFQVHLPAIALPPAGGSEEIINPSPHFHLKTGVLAELRLSTNVCRSCGAAHWPCLSNLHWLHDETPRLNPGVVD